ncbi:MAG: hypothetical protein LBQ76_02225 [Candidatus Fibromonas sp.]|jgi:hypothetical protein|nr:hypothetical protein [Candidatus Fibromonas sp.]
MRNLSIWVKVVICLGLAFLALSCSASKKIQAANILKKCKFTFHSFQMDSFTGDSLKFNIILNAKNEGKDSLFVQELNGFVYLDSTFEVPLSLQKSKWISPGNSQVSFSGAVEMNLLKIPALLSAKQYRMQGKAYIALKPGQDAIDIDFDETRDIPPGVMEEMLEKTAGKAAGKILKMLIGFD